SIEEQVVLLFACTRGFLDDIPTSDVVGWERDLLIDLQSTGKDILTTLAKEQAISKELEAKLVEYLTAFNHRFVG
ncbi:MAG: F0F1 ATP synthase subunit alpha, partial [Acetobacter sp.]|nr:F0F1 ATP synthase subunit alpha [Acetobacter sp.]